MKRLNVLLVLAIVLLILVVSFSAAMAGPAVRTRADSHYSSTIYPCKYNYEDATRWEEGDMAYARNVTLINLGGTDEDGRESWDFDVKTIENLNWNFNLVEGKGWVWGTITQEYRNEDGDEGLWVGAIYGRSLVGEEGVPLANGRGFFYGTGIFEGLQMRSRWRQETHFDQPAEACFGNEPQGEHEEPPFPVKTLIDHHVFEIRGGWSLDK